MVNNYYGSKWYWSANIYQTASTVSSGKWKYEMSYRYYYTANTTTTDFIVSNSSTTYPNGALHTDNYFYNAISN